MACERRRIFGLSFSSNKPRDLGAPSAKAKEGAGGRGVRVKG